MTRFETLSWERARTALSEEWSALVAGAGLNPTLDPHWMEAAVMSHGRARQVTVLSARRDGKLIGVLPMICRKEIVHGLPLRTVDLASNIVSYHPQIVAADSHDAILAAALATAHGGRWDLFRANQIPDGSATEAAIRQLARSDAGVMFEQQGESSPYLLIDGTWDTLLRSRDQKFRANRSRVERRVAEYGPGEMQWYLGDANPERLLRDMLTIEERSWKAAQGTAISARPVELSYHRLLLPLLARQNALMANVLHITGQPVAYVLACNWQGWVGHLKTSFDESYRHVGSLAIDQSVRQACEAAAREYDFLGDATPHKLAWTDRVRPHRSYWLYSSRLPARIIVTAKRFAARFQVGSPGRSGTSLRRHMSNAAGPHAAASTEMGEPSGAGTA